jgi:hypothetical protein
MEVRPGYKLTGVGVIPVEWTEVSLLDLAERRKELFDDGDWVEAEYLTSEGVRLIQTGNIGVGEFIEKENKKYISSESFAKLRCKDLNVGDILICRLAEPAGRACIFPDIGEERVITAVDVTIFRPPTHVVDRIFLVNIFSTSQWFREVSDRCGGSTRTRISRAELGRIVVQLPPLPEQRAIASALSDVDALLAGLDRLIAKKRDLKQAAMQQLLTGKMRLEGFKGEWEVKRLGDVADVKTGPFGSSLHESDYVQDGTPIITVEHLGEFGVVHFNLPLISESDRRRLQSYSLAEGDIVFSRVGSVDRNALINRSEAGWLFSGRLLRVRPHSQRAYAPFLSFQFHGEQFKELVRNVAVGQTMASLNTKILSGIRVSLPSLPEQSAIATVLADMNAELIALEVKRDKTRALKQGMMQELLTGRIRLV